MKKLLFIIILLFTINVSALSKVQQENVALYAREMLEKGSLRKAKDGTPLFIYKSGDDRLYAFQDKLFNGHFAFNCDSLVSYVLFHTYAFPVMKDSGRQPFTVTNYQELGLSNKFMEKIARGSMSAIKDKLEPGDVIVCFVNGDGAHVVMYIGNNQITESVRDGPHITTLDNLATRYREFQISRVKENSATKPLDMSIVWPDTMEKEILGKDDYPTLNVEYDSNTFVKEVSISISMEDDKLVKEYSISKDSNYHWVTINQKSSKKEEIIKENGIYYISIRDSKGQITKKDLVINTIDNDIPVISSIIYEYNGNNTYKLIINATDSSKIMYSLNGDYQESNIFDNVTLNTYQLNVKDQVGNIYNQTIDLSNNNIPTFKVEYDKVEQDKVLVKVIPNNEITAYAISNSKDNVNWVNYNGTISETINTNGTYYILLKNKDNIVYYETVNIDNIPILNNYDIKTDGFNTYKIIINATDNCKITYSLDCNNYQDDNTFYKVNKNNYHICVKDCDNNILEFDIKQEEFPSNYIIIIIIVILIILVIIGIIVDKKRKKKRNDL